MSTAGVDDLEVTCPRCGAALPSGARFCNQCGAAVRAGASGPSAVSGSAPTPPQPSPSQAPLAPAGVPEPAPQISLPAAALVLHHHGPAQRSLHYLALAMLGVAMLFLSSIVLGILREQSH